jgi:hypothetical protein
VPASDRIGFAVFFLFFSFWFWLHGRAVFDTDGFLRSSFCRSMYRSTAESLSGTRVLGALFVIAGVAFVGFALYQLSQGTFRWRGSDRFYGFDDLVPW